MHNKPLEGDARKPARASAAALGFKHVMRQSGSAWEFGIAALFTLVCIVIVISVQKSCASLPHVRVSGTLGEWQVIGRRKSPALRLRMNEEEVDFRVGPSLFREAMGSTLPPEFERGARISALVLTDEYTSPVSPVLDRDARIAWVRGLTVNDREIFGLAEAGGWEQENRMWSYALLLISVGLTVYSGLKWRRTTLRDKTIEPTR